MIDIYAHDERTTTTVTVKRKQQLLIFDIFFVGGCQ